MFLTCIVTKPLRQWVALEAPSTCHDAQLGWKMFQYIVLKEATHAMWSPRLIFVVAYGVLST